MRLRVLGVDPGLTRCGLGVVDGPPAAPSAVAMGVVRTAADLPIERRLAALHVAVADAIDRHGPDVVACERVLFSANARTAMGVGQAAGVALLAAAQAGLPVASYTPTDVKSTVAGHGSADKQAVARMVAAQLRLAHRPTPADVSDALAVALCHLARARRVGDPDETNASGRLRSAEAAAKADGAADWEAVLDRPHVRAVGGTRGER
ncbi:MAG: crossover junction endodeoxyribonuclease RuvC [Actinomycetota bacterium]|nr:crossover junction endodeoxyribonuclease RuvC [Actinomycetota bacterium]